MALKQNLCINGGCQLTFLYFESPHKCTFGSEVGVVNTWCKELFDQLAESRVNKRKLYTNNAVKDNGKYLGKTLDTNEYMNFDVQLQQSVKNQ